MLHQLASTEPWPNADGQMITRDATFDQRLHRRGAVPVAKPSTLPARRIEFSGVDVQGMSGSQNGVIIACGRLPGYFPNIQ